MKRCSAREMHTWATRRWHFQSDRIAHIWSTDNTDCWRGWGQQKLIPGWWNTNWHSHFGRRFGRFLENILLPYDPVIVLLGMYPKELKTYINTKTLHTDIYSSFIYSCQSLEAMKRHFNNGSIQTIEEYLGVTSPRWQHRLFLTSLPSQEAQLTTIPWMRHH